VLSLLGMGAIGGAVLLGIASSTAEQADDHLGAIGGGMLLLGSGGVVVVGAGCLLAAAGVWVRQTWGWLVGVTVSAVLVAGTAGVLLSGSGESPLGVGLVVSAIAAGALWWPDTRRACRV